MSLQRRLTLVFSLIVILPLAVAGLVVQRVVVGEIDRRARESLGPALNAAIVLYNDRVEALDERVRASVGFTRFVRLLDKGRGEDIDDFLQVRLLSSNGLDFLIALDQRGRRVGFASQSGDFTEGFEVPGPEQILRADSGSGAGFARTPELPVKVVRRGVIGAVVGGFWLDGDLLQPAAQVDTALSLVADGQVIASTRSLDAPVSLDPTFGEPFDAEIGDRTVAEARQLPGGMALVSSIPSGPLDARGREVVFWMIGLLVLAGSATALLARRLARLTTGDLEELTAAAQAITDGRFDIRIPVRSRDEIGQLATAFNHMSEQLRQKMGELQESKIKSERSIRRIAETLRSTHDMKQILEAIMETAADAVDADVASLWRFTPTRDELYPALGRGMDVDELDRLRVGEGIAGLVAERGVSLLLPDPAGGPLPAKAEPNFPISISLPLYTDGRIVAVLSLYRKDPSRKFTAEDLNTVTLVAEPGGVALENVTLHEEAQRLSLTDGLTGVYNRRYLQMQFRQVLATAIRFERPFSVLMLDLDHFKPINDNFGHQRGDAILVEFSQRVSRVLREVDTFARYGGEEFVCLLNETNVQGALTTAEKIVDSVRSEIFGSTGEIPIDLTVSIGVAAFPDHGDSWRSLIEAADRALYRAKQEGRDRVCVAEGPGSPPLKLAAK